MAITCTLNARGTKWPADDVGGATPMLVDIQTHFRAGLSTPVASMSGIIERMKPSGNLTAAKMIQTF